MRAQSVESIADGQALLERYCFTCHNGRVRAGGLELDTLDPDRVEEAPAVWEKVVRKLLAGQMPPGGRPRPDRAVLHAFVSHLAASLDSFAAAHPNPGRPAIRRLNRTEYANVVKDLLALDVDVRDLLPADEAQHGFDNMAEALTVSPTLIERHVAAARKVSDLAVGPQTSRPAGTLYPVSDWLDQDKQVSDDLPFGSRGGSAFRHHFPVDGEYLFRFRLRKALYGYIRGLGRQHQLELRVDGVRVGTLRFGGEDKGPPPPATFSGNAIVGEAWEDYMHRADEQLELRVPVKAGTRTVAASFIKSLALPEGRLLDPVDRSTFNYAVDEMLLGNPALQSLEILGPYTVSSVGDTPSRRKIFVCRPVDEEDDSEARSCATRILTTLARRAYRRPIEAADVEGLLEFYERGRASAKTRPFDAGISAALARILIDPEFLFRPERDPAGARPGDIYQLSDLELASRISFFLWSSIPDDELLDIAAAGNLRQPGVLESQVRRMLADPRSTRSLVENFASQWLELRKIMSVNPDPAIYPAFTENLRQAMRTETELFIGSQIREDRSVMDLVGADYTFLNENLARHYKLSNVYGPHFRRVTLTDDRRGGLLGHASLLTITSYATRTSPVVRGAWILETILDAPPPTPPPNVPSFPEVSPGAKPLSVRQRLEQHRKNPVCAACHSAIDPLGFALEHYDAIGRWRATNETLLWYEEGSPIDASGRLLDGTPIDGLSGLREIILSRPEEFATAVSSRLLTYALGRGLEAPDMPAVRRIVREAAQHDYRWSTLVLGVINSVPFQMRSVGP